MQEAVPPRSANGIGRRRGEKEPGTRFDNKLSTGKINYGRLTASGVSGSDKRIGKESPSRERLVYLTTCLIGHHVEIQLKTMDPDQNGVNTNNDNNTRLQSYLKDQFEMLLQEVNNFQKTNVPALQRSLDTAGSVIRFADDPMSSSHSDILHEYNRLLQDFHELECIMVPNHQKGTMYVTDLTDANLLGTAQNPEATTEKNESQNVATWGLNNATGAAQTTDFIVSCGSSQGRGTAEAMSTATYINSSANGIGSRGGMLTSLVNFTNVSSFGFTGSIKNGATSSISRISSWRQGGVREMPKRRQKRRRRYRGVYQTEEEALLKQERLKIKQRATSAEAYQKKKDYIIRLEEQVQRLREQNKCKKTSLMLLRSNLLVNPPLRPLKRTFSGPT